MADKKEDTKTERKGFGVSKNPAPAFSVPLHPAWLNFINTYFPADEHERPDYLTTSQVLDRLNTIVSDAYYTEKDLFANLQHAGFKQLLPPPSGVFVWMMKETPRKMITEAAPVL